MCSAGAQTVLFFWFLWCSFWSSFGPFLAQASFFNFFAIIFAVLQSAALLFFRWHWNSRKELFFATQANWQYAQQGSHAARSWSDKSQYTPASCRRGVEGKQAPRPWHCTSTTEEQPIMKAVGFERGPLSRTPSAGTTCCASAGNPCWADTSPGSGSVTAPISGAISGCTRQGDPT